MDYQSLALWISVVGFFAWMIYLTRRPAQGVVDYLRGDPLTPFAGALTVAATWIWAPALFISAQKAYQHGWLGLFWFLVPNVLCLIVFGFFAHRIKQRWPFGYTLPMALRSTYDSPRIERLYVFTMGGLAVLSYAVQLIAGASIFNVLLGIPKEAVIIAFGLFVPFYVARGGLRSSVLSDRFQMILMLVVASVVVPVVIYNAGGIQTLTNGLGGITGEYGAFWDEKGQELFWAFGMVVTISLMAGPFGDQSFYQRVWSSKGSPIPAFTLGAVIFMIVPLLIGLLGLVAAGAAMETTPQTVNVAVIREYAPWLLVPFLLILLAGLTSTMDSMLSAMMSLWIVDAEKSLIKYEDQEFAHAVNLRILCGATAGILIALIPGVSILHLFLFYGTLRASTLGPTVITVMRWGNTHGENLATEPAVFWGIIASLILGLPASAYGLIGGHSEWVLNGILLTFGLSTASVLMVQRSKRVSEVTN